MLPLQVHTAKAPAPKRARELLHLPEGFPEASALGNRSQSGIFNGTSHDRIGHGSFLSFLYSLRFFSAQKAWVRRYSRIFWRPAVFSALPLAEA